MWFDSAYELRRDEYTDETRSRSAAGLWSSVLALWMRMVGTFGNRRDPQSGDAIEDVELCTRCVVLRGLSPYTESNGLVPGGGVPSACAKLGGVAPNGSLDICTIAIPLACPGRNAGLGSCSDGPRDTAPALRRFHRGSPADAIEARRCLRRRHQRKRRKTPRRRARPPIEPVVPAMIAVRETELQAHRVAHRSAVRMTINAHHAPGFRDISGCLRG